MSSLAFFAHANVFHHGGQPVPVELSIASIPEDGTEPKPEKSPAWICTSRILDFCVRGKFCHLAQGNKGLIVVKGSDQRKIFEKLGLFTINLEILPHFRDLNDHSLPDHLHDDVHEDFNISECTMVKSYRFARYLQYFNKLQAECKKQTSHLVDIPDFFQNPAFCVMGSRSRSGRFERGEERTRGSRDETFSYRETDINPEIFSGPITGALSQSSSRNQFSGNFGRDCYSPDSSHERKSRRDSYSYDDEERRSRRHERDRYDRDRDYDRGRDRSRERDRGRDRGRDRSYDRDEDRRNRDRERMISRERDWREEIPNNTLMVRGLDVSVTENDIQDEVLRYGLKPKDIRLIKEKGTGASRGFAFVEFQLLSEAVRWKELTKGVVIFHGSNRASLHYSIPKDLLGNERHMLNKADWDCPKCGMNNFKRRDYCFKCGSAREDNFEWQHGDCYNEISSTPSNTLLFGNLDVLTTEGRVLAMLGQLTTLPIKSLRVAKDSLTNTSRGYAFVELNSTSEAIQLYELLLSMGGNFYVDGRQVTVSYAKRSLASRNSSGSANAAIVALAAAQWTNQKQDDSYDQYYGVSSSAAVTSSTADATQFSTLDTSVPNQAQMASLGTIIVNGVTYYKYPLPDISTYQYDESSGYYYDSATGLYYDANSQYYYNSEAQQYLYWDGEHQTYLPVSTSSEAVAQPIISCPPTSTTQTNSQANAIEGEDQEKNKNKKEEKLDKVKIAKKIAKDMEKWAKTLNQKKENAKLGIVASPPISVASPHIAMTSDLSRHSATADAGFAILEKRTTLAERNALMAELDNKLSVSATKTTLVSYGDDSDSDIEPDASQPDVKKPLSSKVDESKFVDLSKMACLLCKRQFPNKDALTRHQQLSDLHKKNLAKFNSGLEGCVTYASTPNVWQPGDASVNRSTYLINRTGHPHGKLHQTAYHSITGYRSLSWHYFQDGDRFNSCQVIYSQFGLAIHQNDHQARRRFVEWAQNEIAVVPDFHKRILFIDEAHFWLNGYVNKQNCHIWSEANPQVYVETPLHPEKLTGALYGLVESLVRTSSKTMKATTLQSMVFGIEP
ncbi:RNA-binding protein 5 [Trichonephila clavipes]|nr:RNA-binding protein 5 [Trichonephila clavipes]